MSLSVVKTHPQLIQYVDGLQRKNVDALAFYPRQVFEREADKGRLFLGLLNGEPCGYIYVGAGAHRDLKCHQVCIQYDARRRLYGASCRCGRVGETQAHHHKGYAPEFRLDVVWLCVFCHAAEHSK